jgi:Glyoxalase/Bleomycin resistance protein/Dioxygenase superfamily
VQLNHTIVHARDAKASAADFAEMFDLPKPVPFGPFHGVETANGVTLDFIDAGDFEFIAEHYAFLVTDDEFDKIFGRVQERGMEFWADPGRNEAGVINHHFGGRGVYFESPDGHFLEIITTPYDTGA